MPDPVSTWGIPPAVRRILKARILELRSLLEEDARRQLAAIGITGSEIREPPGGRGLSTEDVRAREVIIAVIATAQAAGEGIVQAIASYVSETAFTFLDRMVAFRSLEERALLLVDDQPETLVRLEPGRGTSSLIWRVRAETPGAAPRDVARAAYRRACDAISERVHVLFDPDDEHSVLFPLTATWDRILAVLNDPTIPTTSYAEDEILGWVYQYWNAAAKDSIYAKLKRGGKIEEAAELTAASTLYTERYIVDYLLQNTLGALWVEMHPETSLPASWPYYVHPPPGNRRPSRKQKRVRDITLVDPCVGSGHFLIRAFALFRQLYMEEAIEDPAEVPALILEHNLHGVDIDRRATQIAALALYIKGCVTVGPDFRPSKINLTCCDVALPPTPPGELLSQFNEPELKDLALSLWEGLAGAPIFGSLLHPERTVDDALSKIRTRDRGSLWEKDETEWTKRRRHLLEELGKAFNREAREADLGRHLFGAEAGRGLDLLQLLGRRYDIVVTNPPYVGSRNYDSTLKNLVDQGFASGRANLYAAFMLRCQEFAKPGDLVGMVTPESWLFLKAFIGLRKHFLSTCSLQTIAHLGTGAFEEITGAVVSTCATVFTTLAHVDECQFVGLRLVGCKSASEKEVLLRASAEGTHRVRFTNSQAVFADLPDSPILYWLRPRLRQLVGFRGPRVEVRISAGLQTSDEERFVRYFWEIDGPDDGFEGRWRRYAKGGGYSRWLGLDWFVVNWGADGSQIRQSLARKYPYLKGNVGFLVRDEELYGQPGLTYTDFAQGSLSCRIINQSIFSAQGPGIFPKVSRVGVAALLNSRLASYLLRASSPGMIHFRGRYFQAIPLRPDVCDALEAIGKACISLKRVVVAARPFERAFVGCDAFTTDALLSGPADGASALLHALEGLNERVVIDAHQLDRDDVQAVLDETGTPAGWQPLMVGYDALPNGGVAIPPSLADFMATLERRELTAAQLSSLKSRLRGLYEAGPGKRGDVESRSDPDEETADEIPGSRIPIPVETFLEELSQKLEVHPISVYWLLKELLGRDGTVSRPIVKHELEEYVSVRVLQLLGYQWPGQSAYETEHGPSVDPTLVAADGIVPLVACGDEPPVEARIRVQLEHELGDHGADRFVRDFRRYVGRDLADWLRRDFFKRHTKQFKNRPLAWHLRSREGALEVFVLYQRLSRATLVKLRAEYAGPRIARLKGEATRAKEEGQERLASDIQIQIEDIEDFRQQLEGIERGAELRDRIRCRWKDETVDGRPGPYAPDIDDGVKVNIRPFQENGLLATTVIKKW